MVHTAQEASMQLPTRPALDAGSVASQSGLAPEPACRPGPAWLPRSKWNLCRLQYSGSVRDPWFGSYGSTDQIQPMGCI